MSKFWFFEVEILGFWFKKVTKFSFFKVKASIFGFSDGNDQFLGLKNVKNF